MHTDVSVDVQRPIDEVFDFAVNHVSEWSKTVVEDEVLEEQPDGVGTTFRCLTEERGKQMEFQGTVTRHEPPHASAALLRGPQFDIDVAYTFEELSGDQAGGTRVTQRSIVIGKGFTKVMLLLLGWTMKKSSCDSAESELNNLKRILEERGADGVDRGE